MRCRRCRLQRPGTEPPMREPAQYSKPVPPWQLVAARLCGRLSTHQTPIHLSHSGWNPFYCVAMIGPSGFLLGHISLRKSTTVTIEIAKRVSGKGIIILCGKLSTSKWCLFYRPTVFVFVGRRKVNIEDSILNFHSMSNELMVFLLFFFTDSTAISK